MKVDAVKNFLGTPKARCVRSLYFEGRHQLSVTRVLTQSGGSLAKFFGEMVICGYSYLSISQFGTRQQGIEYGAYSFLGMITATLSPNGTRYQFSIGNREDARGLGPQCKSNSNTSKTSWTSPPTFLMTRDVGSISNLEGARRFEGNFP